MNGISSRLHWANKPYKWHTNDGEEVFVVLDGKVVIRYEQSGKILSTRSSDIFFASIDTKHNASPIGEAKVLVIEHEASI